MENKYDTNNNTQNTSTVSNLQYKMISLENKVDIYKKEISILEDKLKVYEDDSDLKSNKLNQQVNEIINLENENLKLKNFIKEMKNQSKTERNEILNTISNKHDELNIEMNNLQNIIEKLKKDNKKLEIELEEKKEENKVLLNENEKLQKNLEMKLNENELYNQDNTILINKVKEYEDDLKLLKKKLNPNSHITSPLLTNIEKEINESHFQEIESIKQNCDNQIFDLRKSIMKEIKIICQYLDIYFGIPLNSGIEIPKLEKFTNFPNDAFLDFNILFLSIEDARKKIENIQKNYEIKISNLNKEINNLNNKLQEKILDNSKLKKIICDLQENNFELQEYVSKSLNELEKQKNFSQKIQFSINEVNNENEKYFEKVYKVIINELDKFFKEKILRKYTSIILNTENNNIQINTNRFLFEDALDKYITVNNCLINDYNKILNTNSNNTEYLNLINDLNEEIKSLKSQNSNVPIRDIK
jgi:chromosome segregation ATPase